MWHTITPGQVKCLGRGVKLREGWDDIKLSVMEDLLRQKFTETYVRGRLLDTGKRILVEGNNWGDTFWGVCRNTGQNQLGRLLMKIRLDIRNGSM